VKFDLVRAGFLLVATVICTHLVIVVAIVAVCLWHFDAQIALDPSKRCAGEGRLMEIMAAALAAAIAFAGAYMRGNGPPPPPAPPAPPKSK